ncbi:MAG: hypothetical protein SV760_08950, partial [Halobacteria archaeon]|nr:hypothetical protein [Halobacteria archaeon]
SIAFYLAEYIADSFQEPLDAPDHVQRFNALLWATCHRRVGYSQGCYEFMDRGYELHTGNEKRSPESDLKLLGIRDPDTGELHEIENEGASLDLVKPEAFAPHLTDPIGDPPPDDPEKGEDKTEP